MRLLCHKFFTKNRREGCKEKDEQLEKGVVQTWCEGGEGGNIDTETWGTELLSASYVIMSYERSDKKVPWDFSV